MKVVCELTFNEAEQNAIANHAGKAVVDEADISRFVEEAVQAAVQRASVELEAFENDPSTSVGP